MNARRTVQAAPRRRYGGSDAVERYRGALWSDTVEAVPWKSGASAPRKARRINAALAAVVALSGWMALFAQPARRQGTSDSSSGISRSSTQEVVVRGDLVCGAPTVTLLGKEPALPPATSAFNVFASQIYRSVVPALAKNARIGHLAGDSHKDPLTTANNGDSKYHRDN